MEEVTFPLEAIVLFSAVLIASILAWTLWRDRPDPQQPPLAGLSFGWIELGLLLWMTLLIVWIGQAVAGTLLSVGEEDQVANPTVMILASGLTLQLPMLVIPLLFSRLYPGTYGAIRRGWRWEGISTLKISGLLLLRSFPLVWAAAITAGLVLLGLSNFFPELTPSPQPLIEEIRANQDTLFRLAVLVLSVFLAPIAEELLFRGVIFRFLLMRTSLTSALMASGLLFALAHFHLTSLLPLTLFGVLLGWAYWRTRSLWVPILMHAGFNFFNFIQTGLIGGAPA